MQDQCEPPISLIIYNKIYIYSINCGTTNQITSWCERKI